MMKKKNKADKENKASVKEVEEKRRFDSQSSTMGSKEAEGNRHFGASWHTKNTFSLSRSLIFFTKKVSE